MITYSETKALFKRLKPKQCPLRLYHYTSGSGLIGVITSNSLWATDIRYLNDSTEFQLAIELAKTNIAARQKASHNRYDEGLYITLTEELLRPGSIAVYVVSFSECGDQLSQWRAYCPAAGGYAIGFRSADLVRTLGATGDRFLTRCLYDPTEHAQLIEEIISAVIAVAESLRKSGAEQDRVYREGHKLFGQLLPLLGPILKHSSFKEEQEWRLIWVPGSSTAISPEFRMGRSMITPYCTYSLSVGDNSQPINEIVVGPTPHQELSLKSINALLLARGLSAASARASRIPYRAW